MTREDRSLIESSLNQKTALLMAGLLTVIDITVSSKDQLIMDRTVTLKDRTVIDRTVIESKDRSIDYQSFDRSVINRTIVGSKDRPIDDQSFDGLVIHRTVTLKDPLIINGTVIKSKDHLLMTVLLMVCVLMMSLS
ncbi:hypothetical protein PtB15_13B567 [Puccinia triticina]|nr:hypothetical protein PtB15_13B567 [Puccinia triticina]